MVALAGCAKKPKAAYVPPKPKPVPGGVHLGKTKWTRKDEKDRRTLWDIEWQSADVEYLGESSFGGDMKKVSGTYYEQGKPASEFVAEDAQVKRGTNVLVIQGKVKVSSSDPPGSITCDEVTYDGNKEIIEAKGHLTVVSNGYTVTGIPVVLAKPRLWQVSTPDLFKDSKNEPNANK